ncbi:phosphotransferase enzyme family protein [Streptomyces sp. NPDC014894]|uniref:phosphotransferase enzyme family protein n=1 Tax=Streptomyces sp. NPDC014894 TaxID=3364931 RepID=UPI0036FAE71D
MTRQHPSAEVLRWAGSVAGSPVVAVTGLREGAGPWLLRLGGPRGPAAAVLRTGSGPGGRRALETEAAALESAAGRGIAAPRLLGRALDGEPGDGSAAVLTTVVPGNSRMPERVRPERMRALGAAVAALHAVPSPPRPGLPRRSRPLADVDFAALRRARGRSSLFEEAERAVAEFALPGEEPVLVHGDLWQGNTMWSGDTLTGIVDWDSAGSGHYGVDLGSLRCDAAVIHGAWTAGSGRRDAARTDGSSPSGT